MLPTVPDLAEKENRHGKKWPYTLRFPPSRLAAGPTEVAQEKHLLLCLSPPMPFTRLAADFGSGPEGHSAGRGVCFVRLALPSSDQARRGRLRGAQLDRELLSTPRAADFWPQLTRKRRRRGAQLDGDISFHSFRRQLRAFGRRRRRRGMQLDREFALHASRSRLWGWSRGCGGGALSWTGSLLSTPRIADVEAGQEGAVEGRNALARSLPFYLSLTGHSTGGPAMLGHWSQHHLRL